jgi:hypothetical protein
LESSDTAKRHTGFSGAAFRNSDQPGGDLRFENILLNQQMQRLMRQHGLTAFNAEVLAPFVFGAAAEQAVAS